MAKQPANEQVKSDPKGFLASLKTVGGKHWKEARAKEPRKVGQRIPRGVYEAQVTAVVFGPGKYKKSDGKEGTCPVIRFNFLITSGEYKGANVAKFLNLRPDSEQYSEYDYSDLSDTLKNFGYEMEKAELNQAIVNTLEEISKDKPKVEIFCNVKNGKGANAAKEYQSVSVNGVIDSANTTTEETETEAEDEETETVDYVALGEKADEGDTDAQTELQTAAEEAGHNPDDYATWGELAAVLVPEEEAAEEEVEEEPEPVKAPAKKVAAKAPAAKPTKKPVKKAARASR